MELKKVAIISVATALDDDLQQPAMLLLPPELRNEPIRKFEAFQERFGNQFVLLLPLGSTKDPIRFSVYLNARNIDELGERVARIAVYVLEIFEVSCYMQRYRNVNDVLKLCA